MPRWARFSSRRTTPACLRARRSSGASARGPQLPGVDAPLIENDETSATGCGHVDANRTIEADRHSCLRPPSRPSTGMRSLTATSQDRLRARSNHNLVGLQAARGDRSLQDGAHAARGGRHLHLPTRHAVSRPGPHDEVARPGTTMNQILDRIQGSPLSRATTPDNAARELRSLPLPYLDLKRVDLAFGTARPRMNGARRCGRSDCFRAQKDSTTS